MNVILMTSDDRSEKAGSRRLALSRQGSENMPQVTRTSTLHLEDLISSDRTGTTSQSTSQRMYVCNVFSLDSAH